MNYFYYCADVFQKIPFKKLAVTGVINSQNSKFPFERVNKAINAKISREGVVPGMVQILNHIEISEVEFKNNSHDTTSDYKLEIVIYD